jgi:hypothetical protein
VTTLSPAALRALRIQRLKTLSRAPRVADPVLRDPEPRRLALPPSERADAMAAGLGGGVVRHGPHAVVVVETVIDLPPPPDGLEGLPAPVEPGRPLLCLDTETTGLGTAAGTVPFIVGVGGWLDRQFLVRQLILPDHPDEPALLTVLAEIVSCDTWLVTYNGRTFDWPLLVSRFRLHGQAPPEHAGHLDLLGVARQVWKHRLPDARLANVESGVAGVQRGHDLPGGLIPMRYFAWLRTGRTEELRDVLDHNRQDVVSLAHLLHTLAGELVPAGPAWKPEAPGRPVGSIHPGDLAGLGRAYARRRRHEEALACFEASLEALWAPWMLRELQDQIAIDRARTLARLGRHEDAASAWEAVALDGGPGAALAWVQVSKVREHRMRDPAAALEAARHAEILAARRRLTGNPDRLVERDLSRRLPRLLWLVGRRAGPLVTVEAGR